MQNLKVFVAHSFEEKNQEGKNKSDKDVANWFIKIMKKKPLNFDVVTGSKAAPERIDEKIKTEIADSDCVIGIFTRRYYDASRNRWFTSPFTLCECACGIGFYHNTSKIICGFYEDGIDPKDLALITIGGHELIKFDRERLDDDKDKFIDYLKKIPLKIKYGSYTDPSQFTLYKQPYTQQYLRKIYTIYRNGRVIVQNITRMLISDAERFKEDNKGQILHEIWLHKSKIPLFEKMINIPIEKRNDTPFLQGICRYIGQKKIGTNLLFNLKKEEENCTFFYVGFQDKDNSPLTFKNQDTIFYQYAWGVLGAYARFEEDLSLPGPDGEINEDAYNQAEVVSNHGDIQELEIELRFERSKEPIFSKSPFWQYALPRSDLNIWSQPQDMPLIAQKVEEEDHAMWFQTYKLKKQKFQGRIRVMWRPSSKKHFET